jgi:hypothetical protein
MSTPVRVALFFASLVSAAIACIVACIWHHGGWQLWISFGLLVFTVAAGGFLFATRDWTSRHRAEKLERIVTNRNYKRGMS